ncbi:MAG TPA: pyridoxal phosphate-dependent aminotransferase [Planctomycetota bacterium]
MRFARRIDRIEPSITLALDEKAKAMRAAGRDVISMAVGEPDFPAPEIVQAAAVEKVRSGDVRYTPAAGTPGLRKAVAEHLSHSRRAPYAAEEVTICHSAKHALSGAIFALIEEGDEVLVPLPAWASYFDLVRCAGGTPVLVRPHEGVRPDLAALARAATPRTRAILINSPNNPSGYVYTPAEIEGVVRLALERDLWILSDEIYRALVYGGEALSPASVSPEARARTAIVDGASKVFAMTGYRIGYLAAPRPLAAAVAKLHSQTTGSPNAVSQHAFEAALRRTPPELETMRRAFAERRDLLLAGLAELGLPCARPEGAFYVFLDVSAHLDARGSIGLCEDLLEQQDLVLIPGAAFGVDTHVRLSYALSSAAIQEALRRLGAFLAARRGGAHAGSQPARSRNQ